MESAPLAGRRWSRTAEKPKSFNVDLIRGQYDDAYRNKRLNDGKGLSDAAEIADGFRAEPPPLCGRCELTSYLILIGAVLIGVVVNKWAVRANQATYMRLIFATFASDVFWIVATIIARLLAASVTQIPAVSLTRIGGRVGSVAISRWQADGSQSMGDVVPSMPARNVCVA